MTIKLVRKIEAITNEEWYFIWAGDKIICAKTGISPEQANELYQEVLEKAKLHPKEIYDIIKSEEV